MCVNILDGRNRVCEGRRLPPHREVGGGLVFSGGLPVSPLTLVIMPVAPSSVRIARVSRSYGIPDSRHDR